MSAKDIFASSVGMTHVRKVLTAVGNVDEVPKGQELMVMHMEKESMKVTIKTFDPSSTSGNLTAANFFMEPAPLKWQKVTASFLVDLPLAFDAKDSKASLDVS